MTFGVGTPVEIGVDTTATVRDGKIVVLRRGVVREFQSVNEYADLVALRSGRVPREVINTLHGMMREARYARSEEQTSHNPAHAGSDKPKLGYWLHPEQLPYGKERHEVGDKPV